MGAAIGGAWGTATPKTWFDGKFEVACRQIATSRAS